MIVLDLIHNIAILVALSVGYGLLSERLQPDATASRLLSGVLFGGVCLLGMMTPLRFAPGIIYDGRSIVLSVAAYVAGPLPGLVAGVIAAAYRIWLGGAGTLPGVLTITESVAIGALFYLLRRRNPVWERPGRILIMGLAVHALMLGAQLLLPGSAGIRVLTTLGPAIFVLYSAAVVLISRVFLDWEHKRTALKDLADSEERYRSLFRHSPAVMLIIDPDNRAVVDANPAAERFYGWSHAELSGMKVSDINILGDREIEDEIEAARTSQRQHFEFVHRLADGSQRNVEIFSGPVEMNGKQFLYSIIHDVTARKQAERALRMSLYCIENAVLDIIQVRERDAQIISANRHACRTLGYSEEELCRMTVGDLDPTYTPERADAARERAARTGDFTFETVRRRKDGTIIPVEVTVTYLEYNGERYAFSFARDISARVKHEAALKASIEEKEVLLKEIHHRVKNNLSVIASLLNLQRDRIDSQEEAIGALEKSRDRISTMADIHMLLYEAESFSAVDFSQYAETLIRKLVSVYGRTTEVSLDLRLTSLRLDITRAIPLALILNELVTNSLKHAFVGRESGRLGVELTNGSDELVGLVVWDDGPGLPEGSASSGMTSLGMELVRVLAEQLDGRLQLSKLDETQGHGARVEIVFPPIEGV